MAHSSLTYSNPVWDGYLADPFVFRAGDGNYYAYGTGPLQSDGYRFPVLCSPDLAHWEHSGGALLPPDDPGPGGDYWAPAVAEWQGRYYLYYSAAGREGNGGEEQHRLRVAVAEAPQGPFLDTGARLLPEEGFTIDAHPFQDPADGRWYLFYARDFLEGERPGTALAVVALSEDLLSVRGESRPVLRASADWQIYQRNRNLYGRHWDAWHTVEGPCVFSWKGRYYCLYSGGNWQTPGYGVGYAVADHPLGPWREGRPGAQGATVLQGDPAQGILGPGHNTVVLAPDNATLFLVYHAWDPGHTARRMCLDPLRWRESPEGLPEPYGDGPTGGPRTVELIPPSDT